MSKKQKHSQAAAESLPGYDDFLGQISVWLEGSRRAAARSVNAVMTLTYWELGRQIVEFEQLGKDRAAYGQTLLQRLSADLTQRFGRGFSRSNLQQMRLFYRHWPICQTVSGEFDNETLPVDIAKDPAAMASQAGQLFPLPWSHYVVLIGVEQQTARDFYEAEAIRGGWSIRQLKRQIDTQFYERAALSRNKAAMLQKGQPPKLQDAVSADEEIRDPFVLEFLDLRDEYSERELEAALIKKLEAFLLELGGDFTFVGRQKRLRIDNEWYRIDLLLFHRRLRCLVVVDLKLDRLSHADAGQMHMYLNYAAEHWTLPDENPPVGLILCTAKGEMLAKYSLDGLPNQVLAREYKTALPDEQTIAGQLEGVRRRLEGEQEEPD